MDLMHKKSCKEWHWGISCGDGWNSYDHGHVKRRTRGRKKIRKIARAKLKRELRKEINDC